MKHFIMVVVLYLLLFSNCLLAINKDYLKAIKLVKDRSYIEAAEAFQQLENNLKNEPVYLNRSRIWQALSLISSKKELKKANRILVKILCSSLTSHEWQLLQENGLQQNCSNTKQQVKIKTQIDSDMVSAAITALGSLKWQEKDYLMALELLNLASSRVKNKGLRVSNNEFALEKLNQKEITSREDIIAKSEIQKNLIEQKVFEKILSSKGNFSKDDLSDAEPLLQKLALSVQTEQLLKMEEKISGRLSEEKVKQSNGYIDAVLKQYAQQSMLTPIIKLTCQNPELGKKLALQNAEKITRENKFVTEELKLSLLKIANEGIPDCSEEVLESEWGIKRELTVEEQKAAHIAEKKREKSTRKLAKLTAREPEIFYLFASRTTCQYNNPPQVNNISDVESHIRKAFAQYIEAGRGQIFESYRMTDGKVLRALNSFLDNSESLRQKKYIFDLVNHNRNQFLETLAFCADTLDLSTNFSQALSSIFSRKMTKGMTEETVKNLIVTDERLQKSGRFTDPMSYMQDAYRQSSLGEFYLRNSQFDKALPKLRNAFDNFKVSTFLPKFDYLTLIQSAKTLKNLSFALRQSDQDMSEVKQKIGILQNRLVEFDKQINLNNSISAEEKQERELSEAKNSLSNTFNSPQTQEMLKQANQMFTQIDGGNSENPLSAKLKEFQENMQKGKMDDYMKNVTGKVQKELKAQSPISPSDIFGTSMERNYYRHNNHSMILLLLVNLTLEVDDLELTNKYLVEANSYINKHSSWISPRIFGYHDYVNARASIIQNKTSEAKDFFEKAINAWYFNPHSILEVAASPLEFNAEILEHAIDFFIQNKKFKQAFSYIELARDAGWESEILYGVYSEEKLNKEDQFLIQQLEEIRQLAASKAKQRGDSDKFKKALYKGKISANKSQKKILSDTLVLLSELEPIISWIDTKTSGSFVVRIMEQAKRREALRLRQERATYLAKQAGQSNKTKIHSSDVNVNNLKMSNESLLKKIPVETLLVSVWIGRKSTYVVGADSNKINAQVFSSKKLKRLINQFNSRKYKPRHGKQLYDKLLSPHLDKKHQRIVIVSNSSLQGTPIAAFSLNKENHQWLGDKYLVRTMPRSRYLIKKDSTVSERSLLVLDASSVPKQDKLEFAEQEISAILKHFKGKHVKSNELTKVRAIKSIPNYPLVHFSGHSVLNANIPDYSSMELYGEKLYLAELRLLDLNKINLFVLSSCESAAKQDTLYGDEFSTLQESLHNAGVDSVLATLYKVDDELSSILIKNFYKLLAAGYEKDKALQLSQKVARQAELDMGLDENNWAAFVLSGSNAKL